MREERMNDWGMELCHCCDGTGKDEDAVRAASPEDNCPNCGGTGLEPVLDDDEYWDLTVKWEGDGNDA